MAKQYKNWGKGGKKTVRQDRNVTKQIIIRNGDWRVTVQRSEVDSLIIALLEMRKSK